MISTQSRALRARKHLSSVIRNKVLFTPGLWNILSLVLSQSRIIFPISCKQQKVNRTTLWLIQYIVHFEAWQKAFYKNMVLFSRKIVAKNCLVHSFRWFVSGIDQTAAWIFWQNQNEKHKNNPNGWSYGVCSHERNSYLENERISELNEYYLIIIFVWIIIMFINMFNNNNNTNLSMLNTGLYSVCSGQSPRVWRNTLQLSQINLPPQRYPRWRLLLLAEEMPSAPHTRLWSHPCSEIPSAGLILPGWHLLILSETFKMGHTGTHHRGNEWCYTASPPNCLTICLHAPITN